MREVGSQRRVKLSTETQITVFICVQDVVWAGTIHREGQDGH